MGGHAREMDAPGVDLDEEEYVEAPQEHRVHCEEIGRKDALGLGHGQSPATKSRIDLWLGRFPAGAAWIDLIVIHRLEPSVVPCRLTLSANSEHQFRGTTED